MRCLSLNGFYSIVHECDFKIHIKTFPYHGRAYFMHILVRHLLLQCSLSDRAEALAGAVGTVHYYWHSNKKNGVMKIHTVPDFSARPS